MVVGFLSVVLGLALGLWRILSSCMDYGILARNGIIVTLLDRDFCCVRCSTFGIKF